MPDPFKDVKIIELMELFDDDEVTTADKIDRPERAIERQAIDDFMERNPKAGGGMLVEPGFGGTRQGYKGKNLDRAAYKEIRPITQANIDNYAFFTSKEAAKPYKFKVQLPGGTEVFKTKKAAQAAIDAAPITNRDYTEGLIDFKVPKGATNYDKGRIKIPTGEFIGEGRDKSQIFKIQNKDGSNVKYMASGTGEGKKFYNSIEEIKKAKLKALPDELVKVSSKIIKEGISEVTYKNKKTGKIVKYYKPRVGESKETIPGKGTTSLKKAEKFIKDYYVRNPKPVKDPQKNYATKDRRNVALKETDPTKAAGTLKYNYHHIRQIAGGVPLTTDDVIIINQRINSKIGGKFNEPLNRISSAIQKNNRLALEAMNNKQEGLALEYMKRSDDLNAQAEKIVNSAIDELPKKYKGYVGFNQFTLPRNEYGLPISNEPMIIRKVGGMPVSKDAINLTDLNLKQEAEFRKIVKAQAETGKTGQIKGLAAFIKRNFPDGEIICNLSKGINCNNPQAYQKSINQLTQKAKQGDEAAKATLTRFTDKAATAGRFIKNGLGPLAIASEIAIEGGMALNKTLQTGVPLKTAFADSIFNLALGPKLRIDKEEELKKEFAKGEEFAMAKRGERMFLPQSATADAQRLKKREEEMKALYPQFSDQELIDMIKDRGFNPQDIIDQKTTTRITPAVTSTLTGLDQLRTAFQEQDALQRIADAGGIANLAGGGLAKQAGDRSGAMLESMNPDSQGLQGLLNRGNKI